jgi:CBS-domain-containing membrane protein
MTKADTFSGNSLGRLRGGRGGASGYAGVLSLAVLVLAGVIGLGLKQPWLFPSLGPTVMLFFQSPEQPSSRPLNTLVGHSVGLIVGFGCYSALGLQGRPPAPVGGLTLPYVIAAALSVAVTTAVLSLLALPHPPAGATTLIVSLGILSTPLDLGIMFAAIVLVTLAGWLLNRVMLGRRLVGK